MTDLLDRGLLEEAAQEARVDLGEVLQVENDDDHDDAGDLDDHDDVYDYLDDHGFTKRRRWLKKPGLILEKLSHNKFDGDCDIR